MAGKLEAMADQMMDATSGGGFRHAKLAHGLEIVLERSGRRCRLAMAREAPAAPSDTEIEVVLRAFKAPDGSEIRRLEKMRTHPKSGRHLHLHIAEVRWEDSESPDA